MTADAGAASTWVRATPTALAASSGGASGAAGSAAADAGSAAGGAIRAVMTQLMPPPEDDPIVVTFQFNPERISVSHNFKTEGASGTSADEQIKNLGFVEISIDKIRVTGETTQTICEQLLEWSNPWIPGLMIGTGASQLARPKLIDFTWGEGLSYQVSVRSVTINYSRFAGLTGMPVRADVSLKMYQNVLKRLPSTNPTSGGPPGRKARVLTSSDCLASLAAASYGRPGAWRRIAVANGIDDPLRVRPGTVVYLPEASEPAATAGGLA